MKMRQTDYYTTPELQEVQRAIGAAFISHVGLATNVTDGEHMAAQLVVNMWVQLLVKTVLSVHRGDASTAVPHLQMLLANHIDFEMSQNTPETVQ
jgi:hypothetical protein